MSLKAIKNRITSIKATQKITKAMKMVATAKLKKSKDLLLPARDYNNSLASLISKIKNSISLEDKDIFSQNHLTKSVFGISSQHEKHSIIVLITSDKGLCGSLNSHILKTLKITISQLLQEGIEPKIYSIGKKGYDFCKSHLSQHLINKSCILSSSKDLDFTDLITILETNPFLHCNFIYANFISTVKYEAETKDAFDIKTPALPTDFEFEGNKAQIANFAALEYITSVIYRLILETLTSEQSSRMIAMDGATTNAGKSIKSFTLKYNRIRQASITREISEIVAGVEAL